MVDTQLLNWDTLMEGVANTLKFNNANEKFYQMCRFTEGIEYRCS